MSTQEKNGKKGVMGSSGSPNSHETSSDNTNLDSKSPTLQPSHTKRSGGSQPGGALVPESVRPGHQLMADAYTRDTQNLLQLLEEAACSRDAKRTTIVIGGLVQHIVAQWREVFATTVKTKTNCFFLMPFQEEFPRYLRRELQKAYDGDMSSLFDIEQTRRELKKQRDNLINECEDTKKSIKKFEDVALMLQQETKRREAAEAEKQAAAAAQQGRYRKQRGSGRRGR